MVEAFFTPLPDAGSYLAADATAGPWSLRHQHGGPPSALLVHESEGAARAHTGRGDLDALRVSVDFLGPVPVGEVSVATRVVRAGRSAVLVEGELTAGGRAVLQSRTWLIRRTDGSPVNDQAPVAHHDEAAELAAWTFPYGTAIEWRPVSGDAVGPGPATVWARQRVPVVADVEPSGLQRAVCVADSSSGISSELPWDRWSFANVDVDVHLVRPVVGEWVLLESRTRLSAGGSGLATSTLHDGLGVVGASAQTLVVQALP